MNEKNMNRIIFAISLIITLVVGYFVADTVLGNATGEEFNNNKWSYEENKYCSGIGMRAVEYISVECSLFGCQNIERTKCVGSSGEKKINYNDKIFCKYTVKGDLGLC